MRRCYALALFSFLAATAALVAHGQGVVCDGVGLTIQHGLEGISANATIQNLTAIANGGPNLILVMCGWASGKGSFNVAHAHHLPQSIAYCTPGGFLLRMVRGDNWTVLNRIRALLGSLVGDEFGLLTQGSPTIPACCDPGDFSFDALGADQNGASTLWGLTRTVTEFNFPQRIIANWTASGGGDQTYAGWGGKANAEWLLAYSPMNQVRERRDGGDQMAVGGYAVATTCTN
jgi:hypothetical protein